MPFVQRVVEPRFLSRTSLWDEDGRPLVKDDELEAVTNNTLSNALRQLASLIFIADDIFTELGIQLKTINQRAEVVKTKLKRLETNVSSYDPKKVTVPESDICTFAVRSNHYAAKHNPETKIFTADTRPETLQRLYKTAGKTPVHIMRQLDKWRLDGNRSSRFFLCTPVLGKRRKITAHVDIDIETSMPDAVKELRRWTSTEALGDITISPNSSNRIASNMRISDGEILAVSDDDGIDHKLPSPEEQLQVVAVKFPAEIVAVDISGRSFDRMSIQRRSLRASDLTTNVDDSNNLQKKTKKPRSRRRNTLAGTDHKEIRDALISGEETCDSPINNENDSTSISVVSRCKSSDFLRPTNKKNPEKKSHFSSIKQWGKTRYDRIMNKNPQQKIERKNDIDDFSLYETVTTIRKRNSGKYRRTHERNASISSSEKSCANLITTNIPAKEAQVTVKMRATSLEKRQRRSGGSKDDVPHSSSGNWSASSESGRASIGSEFTSTTVPRSTTSNATSNNSLNQQSFNLINNTKKRFVNASTSSSITSEGTLTPDIINDLHEDGETSSVYSCDTEGYYTSFHLDSGLKTLKEEEMACIALHSASAFSSSLNKTILTAENEYELFGKGSTSTTTSSAGTVCTTVRAADSNRSLNGCPLVPERKSSLSKSNREDELITNSDGSNRGTIKRSPLNKTAPLQKHGDVSPDSGHNTLNSPIESTSGVPSDFSESSDMEGPERIERIRVKTVINSSRIPSMCVITPSQSDDESVSSYNLNKPEEVTRQINSLEDLSNHPHRIINSNVNGVNKVQVITLDSQSGYATIEVIDDNENKIACENNNTDKPPPIIKASLMPLTNMIGKIKTNFNNFTKRESKSPNHHEVCDNGDYVTLADVRCNKRNDEKTEYANGALQNKSGVNFKRETEYVSLDELPFNEGLKVNQETLDSLERKKRSGARVTLDAEGKVVYSSDSLKRKKGAHTTFEPGPFIKSDSDEVCNSRQNVRPFSPQLSSRLIIRPIPGSQPPESEIIRMPPSTVVKPRNRSLSPKLKGAYVHVQDSGKPQSPTQDKDRVSSPSSYVPQPYELLSHKQNYNETAKYIPYNLANQNSDMKGLFYPSQKYESNSERSVTPDITRGLEYNRMQYASNIPYHKLGIPVELPDISNMRIPTLYQENHKPNFVDSFPQNAIKISPIDPRSSCSFQASTPCHKTPDIRAIANLEQLISSPKKSTMSNDELYAVIHKSKKKMRIVGDEKPADLEISTVETKCSKDQKPISQTSRLDFKKLLLQKSPVVTGNIKKVSAVEQLKLTKDQQQSTPLPLNSPTLINKKNNSYQNSPRTPEKNKTSSKLMSPRSQWRFANPRTDVLSSTILEDCREDESPENSLEKKQTRDCGLGVLPSISAKIAAQRAEFFNSNNSRQSVDKIVNPTQENESLRRPTLETAF